MMDRLLKAMGVLCMALNVSTTSVASTTDGEKGTLTRQVLLGDHATGVTDTGGAGEPFILIHALGVDQRMWANVIPILKARGRVVTYDVRGFGSAAGAPGKPSMELFADDLRTLMDQLDIRRAHVVGLSMGGVIGQTFALAYPDRVASLALVATVSRAQPAFSLRGQSVHVDGMPGQIPPTLTRWFTPAMLAVNGDAVRYARSAILSQSAQQWEGSWEAMAQMKVYDRVHLISAPTKVIAGELDVSCPPALMQHDIASRIPGAEMHVIPGATHMVSLTKPAELAALLAK